ncbi:hypothetical protein PCE1_001634 [Barthelona sp. PCE]
MLKPDAVQRRLTGKIVSMIEEKGLNIIAMRSIRPPKDLVERHYEVHRGKPFYPGLVSYITSGHVVAMCVEGLDAITVMRKLIGATRPSEALPSTIRGKYGMQMGRNLVHGSDAVETAEYELGLWFPNGEIQSWSNDCQNQWIYE